VNLPGAVTAVHADELAQRADRRFYGVYSLAFVGTLFVAAASRMFNPEVGFPIAAAVYILGVVCIALRPVAGVYAITFFGLLADIESATYWPFLKTGSSAESLLFVHDSAIVSPMESYLVITSLATLGHVALGRIKIVRPPFLLPLGFFAGFLMLGFVWGLGRGGADPIIGLWEARPFLALFILYLLAAVTITTRSQVRGLFATVIAAVLIEGVRTVFWYFTEPEAKLYDSLVEHSGATHMNIVFIAILLSWLFTGASPLIRVVLPILALPAVWVYIESERRSAFAALMIGIIISLVLLHTENPRRFFKLVPIVFVLFTGYTAAFWNASGPAAFPAAAIRAQISPESQSAADAASDSYRIIEHLDILATIRANPLMGVGFGQQYDRPIPLPDISAGFIWWEYITHNGLMWIWLKTGFFGFAAMFNMFGRGIVAGMRTTLAETGATDKVIVGAASLFIPMYAVYTYVDISWDTQSLILLAVCFAIVAKFGQIPADSETERRWSAANRP